MFFICLLCEFCCTGSSFFFWTGTKLYYYSGNTARSLVTKERAKLGASPVQNIWGDRTSFAPCLAIAFATLLHALGQKLIETKEKLEDSNFLISRNRPPFSARSKSELVSACTSRMASYPLLGSTESEVKIDNCTIDSSHQHVSEVRQKREGEREVNDTPTLHSGLFTMWTSNGWQTVTVLLFWLQLFVGTVTSLGQLLSFYRTGRAHTHKKVW
jgi:hypothetical protein